MATKIAEQIVNIEVWLRDYILAHTEKGSPYDHSVTLDMVETALKLEGVQYDWYELIRAVNELVHRKVILLRPFHPDPKFPRNLYTLQLTRYIESHHSDIEFPL